MNHHLTHTDLTIPSHVVIKRGLDYQPGDSVVITQKGTRNQVTVYVTEVITHKVHELFAIALVSETRPLIDDLPASVGGGPKTIVQADGEPVI